MPRSCVSARRWTCAAAFAAALAVAPAAAHAQEGAPAPNDAPDRAAAPALDLTTAPQPPADAPADGAGTPPASPAPAPPRGVEDRVRDLEETVRLLQEELKRLRAQSEQPVTPKQVEQVVDERLKKQKPLAGFDNGFFIRSENGDFRVRFRGLLHSDARAFTSRGGRTGTDSFYLRRVRPILEGTLYRNVDFRFVPDFGDGRAIVLDAYLDLNYFPQAILRAGKFKEPFSLERLQAAPDLSFVERSVSNYLAPNRDVGVQVSGDVLGGRVSYQVGGFNGNADGGSGDIDAGNDKDFVGRVFAHPFVTQEDSPLKNLGVGLAATIGNRDETVAGTSYRTDGRSAFFRFASNTNGNGAARRLAPQFYYYRGGLGVMGEYITSRQELIRGDRQGAVTNKGGFIQAMYVLTGEKASFRNVVPLKPFDPKRGHWGAVEVGLRYSRVDIDEDNFRLGFAERTNSVSRAVDWTIGINWRLNQALKLQFNYEHVEFDHAILFGTTRRDHENVFLSRLQVVF